MPKTTLQAPKGTRDLYPLEMARRRWLMERWRRVSINHGFEEIEGPTFEQSDLYAIKSGDGILGELFQSFSGKDPKEVESVKETGRAPYAMRPEFTPTLARMYAARAAQLPKPTKWFMAGPFFRAEKPQRGRLREFLQWNADVLGDETTNADRDILELMAAFLDQCGLTPDACKIEFNDRRLIESTLLKAGVAEDHMTDAFTLLDKRSKLSLDAFNNAAQSIELDVSHFDGAIASALGSLSVGTDSPWMQASPDIVRGLAYYTGTVFEVIADGERAVAGGGRYDNLVELFGGPPTPAVGFGMGDVVLTNLLQDKDLMPSDKALLDEIGARPDVFLITTEPDLDEHLARTLAHLRKQGLHARRTTKTTRNIGKLLQDASKQHARYAIILESATTCTIKDLDSGDEQKAIAVESIVDHCRP